MNYSFAPMSALHLSDIFNMPVGAALAPESTVGRIELDSAFAWVFLKPVDLDARGGIVGIDVRANAALTVSTCGVG